MNEDEDDDPSSGIESLLLDPLSLLQSKLCSIIEYVLDALLLEDSNEGDNDKGTLTSLMHSIESKMSGFVSHSDTEHDDDEELTELLVFFVGKTSRLVVVFVAKLFVEILLCTGGGGALRFLIVIRSNGSQVSDLLDLLCKLLFFISLSRCEASLLELLLSPFLADREKFDEESIDSGDSDAS